MSKKYKKHGYAERLKYMHMIENGCSINYIHEHYGIDGTLLGHLWTRYQSEGPSGLLKKQNVKADYAFKIQVLRALSTPKVSESVERQTYSTKHVAQRNLPGQCNDGELLWTYEV